MSILYTTDGPVAIVTIDRPEVANAIDAPAAAELADAFRQFDRDDALAIAVLSGTNQTFSAVAVEGHAVAGGLELAAWCDLRVAAQDAVFGVYCRRWGIPLMDGGTIRLARLIGHSHALDMILTGRGVSGEEAFRIGLANRVVPRGQASEAALELAREIAERPQAALRSDRLSSYEQWSLDLDEALANEYRHGMATLETGQMLSGLDRYASGEWRRSDGSRE
jgi:enoyl-CoA hydratase